MLKEKKMLKLALSRHELMVGYGGARMTSLPAVGLHRMATARD